MRDAWPLWSRISRASRCRCSVLRWVSRGESLLLPGVREETVHRLFTSSSFRTFGGLSIASSVGLLRTFSSDLTSKRVNGFIRGNSRTSNARRLRYTLSTMQRVV
jgi:hypothetical protein